MRKKIIIICIVTAVLIGTLLILISNKQNNSSNSNNIIEDNTQKNDSSLISEIKDTINTINDINKIFKSDDFLGEPQTNFSGYSCDLYLGDDANDYIEKLSAIYINPFYESGYFQYDEYNGELYVCKPVNKCEFKDIKSDDIKIIKDEEQEKIVSISGNEYIMQNIEGSWRFIYPIVSCDREFDKDQEASMKIMIDELLEEQS